MIQLELLARFLAVAEKRSYGEASRQLHLSQSTLTRSIQALERQMGVSLFERIGSGVRPTAVAEQMLGAVRDLLTSSDRFEKQALGLTSGISGDVAFAIGPYVAALALPKVSGALLRNYPRIRTRIVTGESAVRSEQLFDGRLDFFVGSLVDARRLRAEPLGNIDVSLFVRVGHPLAGLAAVSTEDLEPYPRVSGTAWSDLASAGPQPQLDGLMPITLQLDNHALAVEAALDSDAVLAMPRGIPAYRLHPLPIGPVGSFPISLYTVAARSLSPVAETVAGVLRNAMAAVLR